MDWQNEHVFKVACWVYDPISIWLIPTVSFAADTAAMRSPRLLWDATRSCVELLLMVPWIYAWAIVSFFFLGGGWI